MTLPGAGLWHVDFAWKDRDEWPRYFHVRNALVAAALHGGFDRKRPVQTLRREISQDIVAMQYGLAFTRIKGIEDFLRGRAILRDGGIEALAAIRSARAEFRDTLRHPASAAADLRASEVEIVAAPPGTQPDRPDPDQANARPAPQTVRQGSVGIAARDSYWWHV